MSSLTEHRHRPANKSGVRAAFDRAADVYDSVAHVQRAICDDLATWLPERLVSRAPLLDAGCGTGFAVPLLQARYPHHPLMALDLAPAMLRQPRLASCLKIAGDLEALPLADASLSGCWSSLAIQWCAPDTALHEIARVLQPGAHAWIATLGPGTLGEIRQAFTGVDDADHVLHFHDTASWLRAARDAGLHVSRQHEATYIDWAPDPRSQLQAIRRLGAGEVGQRRRSLLGKTAWQQVCARLEQHRQPQGLPTRYQAILLDLVCP